MDTKICRICHIEKKLSEFPYEKTESDRKPRYRTECKKCRNEDRKTRYNKNIDYNRSKSLEWRHQNPVCVMYVNCKARAKLQNVPFNIEKEDIVIPDICPILGIPLIGGYGKLTNNSPSLDKINPLLGYVKGNIRVISFRANRLKSDCTLEEMKKIVEYMERESGGSHTNRAEVVPKE